MSFDIGRLSDTQFQPFPHPADASLSAGEFAWIRDGKAQFWRGTEDTMPKVAPYPFARAEIIYVIEGAVDIELPSGETVHLGEGDVGAFDQHTDTTWTFTFPFTKLSVFPEDDA